MICIFVRREERCVINNCYNTIKGAGGGGGGGGGVFIKILSKLIL